MKIPLPWALFYVVSIYRVKRRIRNEKKRDVRQYVLQPDLFLDFAWVAKVVECVERNVVLQLCTNRSKSALTTARHKQDTYRR